MMALLELCINFLCFLLISTQVYKGVWRGQEIAIKKLKNQNPSTVEQNEFMNEVKPEII